MIEISNIRITCNHCKVVLEVQNSYTLSQVCEFKFLPEDWLVIHSYEKSPVGHYCPTCVKAVGLSKLTRELREKE
jgi:hypothetical protein